MFFLPFHAQSTLLLQIIFFFGSLKIDLGSLAREFLKWRTLVVATLFRLVLAPLVAYLVALLFAPDLIAPLLLLGAMPAGMTSPLFVSMLGGNVPLSLLVTVSTALLAPLTIPFLLSFFGGSDFLISFGGMVGTLFLVIVAPFFLAQVSRFFLGRIFTPSLERITRPLSFAALFFLVGGITAAHQGALLESFRLEFLLGFFLLVSLFISVHIGSYFLFPWRTQKDRLTLMLSLSYMNYTLAIYLAERFFQNPSQVLLVVLSFIPWNIGLILLQLFWPRIQAASK